MNRLRKTARYVRQKTWSSVIKGKRIPHTQT